MSPILVWLLILTHRFSIQLWADLDTFQFSHIKRTPPPRLAGMSSLKSTWLPMTTFQLYKISPLWSQCDHNYPATTYKSVFFSVHFPCCMCWYLSTSEKKREQRMQVSLEGCKTPPYSCTNSWGSWLSGSHCGRQVRAIYHYCGCDSYTLYYSEDVLFGILLDCLCLRRNVLHFFLIIPDCTAVSNIFDSLPGMISKTILKLKF